MNEVYKRCRPKTLDAVVGQDKAVSIIQNAFTKKNVPHVYLISGPSGTGKTTLARIIRDMLGCDPSDFFEQNASDFRGVDSVRDIRARMGYSGLSKGKVRVYYLDEVHHMTGIAQNAALKMLEDTPKHVYFILSTTDPSKVIKAVQSRCTKVVLTEVAAEDMKRIVKRAAKKCKIKVRSDKVMRALVNASNGGPREALVLLEMLQGVKTEKEQLAIIEDADSDKPTKTLAQALIGGMAWLEVAKLLKDMPADKVESTRMGILGYCAAILMNGAKNGRAADIIAAFSRDCYGGKKPEFVGRIFDIINGHSK